MGGRDHAPRWAPCFLGSRKFRGRGQGLFHTRFCEGEVRSRPSEPACDVLSCSRGKNTGHLITRSERVTAGAAQARRAGARLRRHGSLSKAPRFTSQLRHLEMLIFFSSLNQAHGIFPNQKSKIRAFRGVGASPRKTSSTPREGPLREQVPKPQKNGCFSLWRTAAALPEAE